MKEDRSITAILKWSHPEQTREMFEHVSGLEAKSLEIAIEPSGTYGDALRLLFVSSGIDVWRISPKRTHDAQEIYDGTPSLHDAKSACIIARLCLDGAGQRWEEQTEQRRDADAAIALLEMYHEQHQRGLNRLEALLSRHWPEAEGLLGLTSVTLAALTARFGSPAEAARCAGEAEALMRNTGRSFLSEEKILEVTASAQTTLGVPCTEAERARLMTLGQEVMRTHKAIAEAKKEIEKKAASDPVLSRMAAVIGKVTSTVLIAESGNPQDYPSACSYIKNLGLNLKERSSGRHQGELRITKRGSGMARKYLYLAAQRQIDKEPFIKRWYQKKVKRDGGAKGAKGKAVTAVMRKLAKSLWHVARGEPFDTGKLFNTRLLEIGIRTE